MFVWVKLPWDNARSSADGNVIVDEAVEQAKASPFPPNKNLTKNMNLNLENIIVRGVDSQTFHPLV